MAQLQHFDKIYLTDLFHSKIQTHFKMDGLLQFHQVQVVVKGTEKSSLVQFRYTLCRNKSPRKPRFIVSVKKEKKSQLKYSTKRCVITFFLKTSTDMHSQMFIRNVFYMFDFEEKNLCQKALYLNFTISRVCSSFEDFSLIGTYLEYIN